MKLKRTAQVAVCALAIQAVVTIAAEASSVSDFEADVQKGQQSAMTSAVLTSIRTQDNKTSWDEFGTNILIDGVRSDIEIQKSMNQDIINSLQTEVLYNQKDEQYLQLRNSTPEEVTAVQGDGNSDLLPEDYIEPHPSLDANPEVNVSTLDAPISTVDTTEVSIAPDAQATHHGDAEVKVQEQGIPNPAERVGSPETVGVFELILPLEHASDSVPVEPSNNTPEAVIPTEASAPLPTSEPSN